MIRSALANSVLRLLARTFMRAGNPKLAAACYSVASTGDVDSDSILLAQARALWACGDVNECRSVVERVFHVSPENSEAHTIAAALGLRAHDYQSALRHAERALATRPDSAPAHNNAGSAHAALLNYPAAEASFLKALQLRPGYVEALTNLGELKNRQGDYAAAEQLCRDAVNGDPNYAGAYCNLGNALFNQVRIGEAVAAYRKALELQPDMAAAHINLSVALGDPEYLAGAIEHYKTLLAHDPGDHLARIRIGQGLQALDRFDEAEDYFLEALQLRADAPDVLSLLGNNELHQGNAAEAISYLRKVVALGPHLGAQECIVFSSIYLGYYSGIALRREAELWAEQHARTHPVPSGCGFSPPQAKPRLRIGYVSRDFGFHSVSFFLEPIFKHHDRSRFEICCYSNVINPDAVTARFRAMADLWRDIAALSDADVATMIRDDEVDILIDLSGHTSGNRLPVFQRRPAPVQVTYLGHPGTTGLVQIDYRISDAIADPVGVTEDHYVETVWRLSAAPFLVYAPPAIDSQVASLPSATAGHITFGSFNNAAKISDETIRCWSQILVRIPSACLFLKNRSFESESARGRFAGLFRSHGVAPERIIFSSWSPTTKDHLDEYAKVDIALDTFPYNGTTTTCEALWMGVPVVACRGERHSALVGASLLTSIGLTELVARDTADFVERAIHLVDDSARLGRLRSGLREMMLASPLLDACGFTQRFEHALNGMWAAACNQNAQVLPSE